jgi:hypothetical protein
MDRAFPFLISGVLIILGLVATSWLDARLNCYVTGSADTDFNPKLTGELAHLQPGQLWNVVLYWIDMTQAAAPDYRATPRRANPCQPVEKVGSSAFTLAPSLSPQRHYLASVDAR